MTETTIASVQRQDHPRFVQTLVLAFANDPVVRWLFPSPDQYLRWFPELVGAFAAVSYRQRTAWQIADCAGAMIWLGPGSEPDEAALVRVLELGVADDHRQAAASLFEQMAAWHPSEPHWYLPLIGVDPRRQGLGYGSALLAQRTSACDREGLPAYLEATSPANIALYRRHGFRELGVIRSGESPPLTPMWRDPQRAALAAAA